jgi:hemerythrin-like domain-containing protein
MKPYSSADYGNDQDVFDETVDAIDLLTADHEDVNQLFAAYQDLVDAGASAEERAELAGQICLALTVHTSVEEQLFYPVVRDALVDPGFIDESVAEHARAKALIEQLRSMSALDARYDSTVKQLQEAIEHHVRDEERELFPQVQEQRLDLGALGERMAQRKDEVLAELKEKGQA